MTLGALWLLHAHHQCDLSVADHLYVVCCVTYTGFRVLPFSPPPIVTVPQAFSMTAMLHSTVLTGGMTGVLTPDTNAVSGLDHYHIT